jgi:hypothetical protein
MNKQATKLMFQETYNDFPYHYMVRDCEDGQQIIFRLDNGYGLSAVNFTGSYGNQQLRTYECAVIKFKTPVSWELCFNTPITEDVIGYCSPEKIQSILEQLNAL